MKNMKTLLIVLLCVIMTAAMLVGCAPKMESEAQATQATPEATEAPTEAPESEVTEAPEETEAPAPAVEAAFSIEELEDGIKKVTDGEGRELILVPREMAEVPEAYADSIVIRTPIENAVYLSSTQVCSLRLVDNETVWDAIGGVSGGPEMWADIPAVQSRLESGDIINVGGGMGDPDYEALSGLNPDVVFVYTGSWPQTSVIDKLTELGINYAVDNEYMEESYLSRMKWAEFVLSFYNMEDAAAAHMADAAATVEAMKEKIAGEDIPKVIFASEYNGTISVTDPTSWLGEMITDAGADYMFKDLGDDALSLSMEDFIAAAKEADIIVYTSTPLYMPDQETLFSALPLLADVPAVQNGQIYQYTNAFWMGVDKSDVMVEDMAAIFHPDAYADREQTFFTPVAE